MPHRSDFGTPCCLRPTEAGSALGSTPFEATFTFTVVTARQLVVSPRETLSIGFRILISLHPAIQTTGRLTFAPAGLPPAEHTSLNWTHFRAAGFPSTPARLSYAPEAADKTGVLIANHLLCGLSYLDLFG